jgi:cytochrome c5
MLSTRTLLTVLIGLITATIVIAGNHGDPTPSGETVHKAHCANCHSSFIGGFFSGAPTTGDEDEWAPLVAKGLDTLTANTIAGVGEMPARGQCEACTDDEIRAAVAYMLEQVQ